MSKKKSIYYIRSTSIVNDSRATKEILSLINNDYDVTVIGWDRDNRVEDYNNFKINGKTVKSIFFKYKSKYGMSLSTICGLIKFQFWLKKTLKKNVKKMDYIHACDFDCGYMASKIAKKYNKKIIYDMYDYYSDSRTMTKILKKFISTKENKVINNSDLSIICGEWRKKQICKSNPKRLIVIHNTPNIDYKETKSIIKSKSKKIKVCYVGILQTDRLLLELLNEFKKHKDLEFHVGGFGIYEKEFSEASAKYSNIFYYGSLKYNQVLELESDCDILFATYNPIIENHRYSAPNKIYEAMALGKPIIVCNNTGIDELVNKNNTGFVIDYNAKEFFDILYKFKDNKKILNDISKNAKSLYSEKYNWNIMEKRLINEYRKLDEGSDKNV